MFKFQEKREVKRLKETIHNQNNMIDKLNKSIIETSEHADRFRSANASLFSENERLKREINDLATKSEEDIQSIIAHFSPFLGVLGIDTERYLSHRLGSEMWSTRALNLFIEFIKGKSFVMDGIDASSTFINTDLKTLHESLAGTHSIEDLPDDRKEALRQLGFLVMTINSFVSKEVIESRRKTA